MTGPGSGPVAESRGRERRRRARKDGVPTSCEGSEGVSPYGPGDEDAFRGPVWLPSVGVLVVLVGDRLEPRGGVLPAGEALQHGEVAHEGVRRGAVPVLLPGRADDGVTGAHAQHRAVARAHQPDAL